MGGVRSEVTLLILCITKRLVWADSMLCKPERLVDSDEKARVLLWQARELSMVTRSLAGGAAESETGVVSLGSDVRRNRPMSF